MRIILPKPCEDPLLEFLLLLLLPCFRGTPFTPFRVGATGTDGFRDVGAGAELVVGVGLGDVAGREGATDGGGAEGVGDCVLVDTEAEVAYVVDDALVVVVDCGGGLRDLSRSSSMP